MVHQFNEEVAKEYGILEAILLDYFEYSKRMAGDGEVHSDSIEALCKFFPYATEKEIRDAVRHLEEIGVKK